MFKRIYDTIFNAVADDKYSHPAALAFTGVLVLAWFFAAFFTLIALVMLFGGK